MQKQDIQETLTTLSKLDEERFLGSCQSGQKHHKLSPDLKTTDEFIEVLVEGIHRAYSPLLYEHTSSEEVRRTYEELVKQTFDFNNWEQRFSPLCIHHGVDPETINYIQTDLRGQWLDSMWWIITEVQKVRRADEPSTP